MSGTDDRYDQRQFRRWLSEITQAQKDTKYKLWLLKAEKITRRYRDERNDSLAQSLATKRYNILWANVQTLGPAVYGKMPKPVAERRFLDRDPAARLASMILERVLSFQMQQGGFHEASKQAVHKDYLLPGMGQLWIRYVPEFKTKQIEQENKKLDAEAQDIAPENAEDEGFGEVEDELTYERLCFDYVFWRDFLWSPSRTWAEVPWVAKRCWLDYKEAEEQFGKNIADRMTFGDPKSKEVLDQLSNEDPGPLGRSKKAEVWEIWCKPERKAYFIAPDSPGLLLKEEGDPLKLEGFWPCPEPLFTTQTNDTLIPVPDYVEYQDQAAELDDLTDRIDNITSAVRANGVYDSQWPALQRLMQKGQDNILLPVEDWAKFSADNNGISGAISLLPMKEIIEVLQTLITVREQVLQDVYQITGIADIIRGVSDPNETATAQKIKSNYATGRLGARQQKVADFCVNTIRIAAELIAEIFSDQSLRQMSGVDQLFADQVRSAVEAIPAPQPAQPSDTGTGQSPAQPQAIQLAQQQAMMQWQQAKAQAAQTKTQELETQFQQALAILRSDKLRGFRVDIETDSTIADDLQQDKQAVTEFVTGLLGSLESSIQLIANAPEFVKAMGDTVMWSMRKMRAPRTLETVWEEAIDRLEKRVEDMKNQPPKPDPEMIKAQSQAELAQVKGQAVTQKAQSDIQIAQLTAQAENARSQADIQVQSIQLQTQTEEAHLKSQIEQLKLQLDAVKNANDNFTDEKKAKLAFLQAITVAQIAAGQQTDAAQLTAQVETILGFSNIAHETNQAALDRQHEAGMAAQQQQHEKSMPKPKPNGATK